MCRCVTGFTDTCRKYRAAISKRGHSNSIPVRHRSLLAARGARPGHCLPRRRIRMLFGRLFEKVRRLIRFSRCSPRSTNFTKKRLGAGGVASSPWRSAAGRVVRFRGRAADGGCDDQRRHRSRRRSQFGARATQYGDHAFSADMTVMAARLGPIEAREDAPHIPTILLAYLFSRPERAK
jgi:hypothetical protein